MPKLSQEKILPYSAKAIFDLVIDIESYPQFLPWCVSAKIIEKKSANNLRAQLGIEFKGIAQNYVSDVSYGKISAQSDPQIEAMSLRGNLQTDLREESLKNAAGIEISDEISLKNMAKNSQEILKGSVKESSKNFSGELYFVEAVAIKGPFKSLINRWKILAISESSCKVDFFLNFEFNSMILTKMLGLVFGSATEKMMQAFETRAATLAKS